MSNESALSPDESGLGGLLPGEEGAPALGRDPFAEVVEIDPFLERLDAVRTRGRLAGAIAASARASAPLRPLPEAAPEIETGEPRRQWTSVALPRRRRARIPALAEVEAPEPRGWFDRLIGEDERRRLAALSHLVEGELPFDRYGFSPETARLALPFFMALYRGWFRVRSQGHEHLPREGAAVLVANHGGLLPFDAAMGIIDVVLHTDPPRLLRSMVDRWAGTLPWINIFYARVGQVIGTRENFTDLLDDGQLVLVFPEGIEGIRKLVTQRYRLQSFHVGFVEHALRARAPIIPVAFIGSDDQAPILFDLKTVARRLGLPVLPITPTFPWLGPLGLVPYPVSYKIVYGEPLNYHERFGPEGASDSRLVRYLANQARRAVQLLVDRNRT
jgi:1-acyl-sn-glycerol-3-phosphate acyltransferase